MTTADFSITAEKPLTSTMGMSAMESDTGAIAFAISQLMGQANHVQLVLVKAVTPAGTGPQTDILGTVDVQPMVHMIDGAGKTYPHGIIRRMPYFRLQAGSVAIIMDPVVGDIGLAAFCDRDVSLVRQGKTPSGPGSRRRFAWSDGIYFGGVLGKAPQHFVALSVGGTSRDAPDTQSTPPGVVISSNLPITIQGDLHVTGVVIAGYGTGDAVGLQTHVHGQPNDAHGDGEQPTFPPTPGL